MTITESDLVGAWRLADFVLAGADGTERRPWAEGSDGLLIYAADGFMSVATAVVEEPGGKPAFMAYHGTFDLYADRVVHHIEMSSEDHLVGRSHERLVGWDGEILTLTASPSVFGGEGSTARILWRRARRG